MLNIIGYFFSTSYMPMHDLLKRKICKEKIKRKKNQNALYMIASVYSRRCVSYKMCLECDSLHQIVMIVCELKWFSHILNRYNMKHLCTLAMFSHTIRKFFATFDTHAGTMWFGYHKNICVNVCSLNYHNLFLKYKIG